MKGILVEPGYRWGRLTVIEPTNERVSRYVVWRCRCDCGHEILLDTRRIQRGTTVDCGCGAQNRSRLRDLRGQRFGKLIALASTDKRGNGGSIMWQCRCDCGREALVPASQLVKGYVKSCGCMSHPPLKDYVGRRFGKLTVLNYEGKAEGQHMWQCRCDCGGMVTVRQTNLQSGKTQSCGCIRGDVIRSILGLVEGTSIRLLEYHQTHLSALNTSGYNGVYQHKRTGEWCAQVTFRGKTINLGRFRDKDDAINARRRADMQIQEYLKQYYDEHPDWECSGDS